MCRGPRRVAVRSFVRGEGTAVAYTPRGYGSKQELPLMIVHFIGAGPGARSSRGLQ